MRNVRGVRAMIALALLVGVGACKDTNEPQGDPIDTPLEHVSDFSALGFHVGPFRVAADWNHGTPTPLRAKIAAAVSLLVWTGVVTAGRLIAYV